MKNAHIPILGFAAPSGTGKTTLLTQLLPLLQQQQLRAGLIKHSHHNFQIDQPGKDSFRLREAGANPVMLVSSHRRALMTEFSQPIEPELDDQLQYFDQQSLDLILVEGFKQSQFPKIELHRPALNTALLYPDDPSIIAFACDQRLPMHRDVVCLDLNNISQICAFICQYIQHPYEH